MTIDEAIRHCVEVAEEQEELYRICPASESEMYHCNGTKDCRVLKNGKNKGCKKCAEEHSQFAEWLKELNQLRKQTKTGHWIDYSEEGFVECSECGSATNCDGNINELHFCFSCGARMNEDERTLKYADQDTMMPAT